MIPPLRRAAGVFPPSDRPTFCVTRPDSGGLPCLSGYSLALPGGTVVQALHLIDQMEVSKVDNGFSCTFGGC